MKRITPKPLPPNPTKILRNISCFKKILNGFKVTDRDRLIDILMYQPKLIHSCMTKGYTPEDANFFKLSCTVHYNIPLVSSAWFGEEKGYALKKKSDASILDLGKEELSDFLNKLDLPHKIIPVNMEMKQTIDNIESTFTFKINKD